MRFMQCSCGVNRYEGWTWLRTASGRANAGERTEHTRRVGQGRRLSVGLSNPRGGQGSPKFRGTRQAPICTDQRSSADPIEDAQPSCESGAAGRAGDNAGVFWWAGWLGVGFCCCKEPNASDRSGGVEYALRRKLAGSYCALPPMFGKSSYVSYSVLCYLRAGDAV